MFHGREHDQRDQLSDEAIVQCHVSGTAQNMAQPGEIRSHDAVAFIHCLILGFDTFNTGKQQTRDVAALALPHAEKLEGNVSFAGKASAAALANLLISYSPAAANAQSRHTHLQLP